MVNELGDNTTLAAIDRYHETLPRHHRWWLGMSEIGESCSRRIWYRFRWTLLERFPGRILRLFRRGHREEETVIEDLRAIGCAVTHTGDDQIELKIGPHVLGHPDGVIESGLPEAPNKKHLLEIKTHNLKSFAKLWSGGPPAKHMAQMQGCMKSAEIDRTLYVAVCKDNDEMYIERIRYNEDAALQIHQRAEMIVNSRDAPLRIKDDPTWYECKFCPFKSVCYKEEGAEKNCRTCAHSTPNEDGWYCERWGKMIPDHIMETGCDAYIPHPAMHPGKLIDGGDTWAVYKVGEETVKYGG